MRCTINLCLNEVRPRRPEQCGNDMAAYLAQYGLNEVRPRRPEQFVAQLMAAPQKRDVSMKSGLEGRNN